MFVPRFVLFVLTAAVMSLTAHSASALLLVQISGLNNFNLPNWTIGDNDVNAAIDVCVYSTVINTYNVTVSNAGGYKLTSGLNSIPYSLTWDDGGVGNLGAGSGTPLSNGVALPNRGNANAVSPVCLAGPNARLNLKITKTTMEQALAGLYIGSVTIMISPS